MPWHLSYKDQGLTFAAFHHYHGSFPDTTVDQEDDVRWRGQGSAFVLADLQGGVDVIGVDEAGQVRLHGEQMGLKTSSLQDGRLQHA